MREENPARVSGNRKNSAHALLLENTKALCYNGTGDGSFIELMTNGEVFPWTLVSIWICWFTVNQAWNR